MFAFVIFVEIYSWNVKSQSRRTRIYFCCQLRSEKNLFFLFESQKTHSNDRTPKMNDFKKDGIGFIHADLYGI